MSESFYSLREQLLTSVCYGLRNVQFTTMLMYTIKIIPKTLHFKQPAGTSRGVYRTRKVWYLLLTDTQTGKYGVGECAPLPALSCDDLPDYEEILVKHCRQTEQNGTIDYEALRPYPSMLFGLETAFAHLKAGNLQFWQTPFQKGKKEFLSTD